MMMIQWWRCWFYDDKYKMMIRVDNDDDDDDLLISIINQWQFPQNSNQNSSTCPNQRSNFNHLQSIIIRLKSSSPTFKFSLRTSDRSSITNRLQFSCPIWRSHRWVADKSHNNFKPPIPGSTRVQLSLSLAQLKLNHRSPVVKVIPAPNSGSLAVASKGLCLREKR